MKRLKIILVAFICIIVAQTKSQTTCTDFLNDFIPKSTDSVLEINLRFLVFSPPVNGVWIGNNQTRGENCVRMMDSLYANIAAPQLTVSGVSYIPYTKIKFKLKQYLPIFDSNYTRVDEPPIQMLYADTNAINIYFGNNGSDLTGTSVLVTGMPGNRIFRSVTAPTDIGSFSNAIALVHEIGHTLGLKHSLATTFVSGTTTYTIGDGTSEIYPTAGCCNTITATDYVLEDTIFAAVCGTPLRSNNMMSENSGCNRYFSPQQMAIMHYHLRTDMRSVLTSYSYNNHINRNAALDYSVTSNETWSNDRYMKGDVTVKSGKTLNVNCLVGMASGTRFIVERGALLIVSGGTLTNISGQIWRGVEVCGDPSNDQSINASTGLAYNQGMVIITLSGSNLGEISYANNATSNFTTSGTGSMEWGSTGGIIIGNYARFINNLQDAEFITYPYYASASRFNFCDFKTTTPIGDTVVPFAHVTIWDTYGILFRGCNFEYAGGTSYPTGSRGYGIHSIDAVYTIDQYCDPNGPCPSGTVKNTFKKLNTGLHVLNSNPLRVVSALNTEFYDNDVDAAFFQNMNPPIFHHNYISTPSGFNNSNGLYLHTCKYYAVSNNTFLQNSSSHSGTGAYVYNSQGGAHNMYHNSFAGFDEAMSAVDNNSGTMNTADGLKMNCNDFSQVFNNYDVLVLGQGSAGNAPTVKRTQGVTGALATATNVVRNIYAAPCGNQNKWYMEGEGTNSMIIKHGCNSTAATQPTPQPSCSYTNVNVVAISAPLTYTVDCPEYDLSMGGNGTATTNPSGRLANAGHYLDGLQAMGGSADPFEVQATVATQLSYYLADTLPSSKDTVINMLGRNPGSMDDADILLVFAYMHKGDYTTAYSTADALGGARADWKALLKKLISLYQEPAKIYTLNSDTSYKNFMMDYAYSDGRDGQFTAQALLSFVCGETFTEPRPRPAGEGSRLAQPNTSAIVKENINKVVKNFVQVYPNPAQSGVMVYYSPLEASSALVEVKDLPGRIIYTNFINSGNELYVPLVNLSNGIYIITVSRNKELLYTSKLVKQD